jgi:hypothetical protein
MVRHERLDRRCTRPLRTAISLGADVRDAVFQVRRIFDGDSAGSQGSAPRALASGDAAVVVEVKAWASADDFIRLFAIAPLVVGLILSGGYVLATPAAVPDWRLWLIAGATATAMLATNVNPLWFLAAGGAAGVVLLS